MGSFCRGIRDIRDIHSFRGKIKFSEARKTGLNFYFDLVEYLAASNVRIGASVYDSRFGFRDGIESWKMQAIMSAKLIAGNTNKDEVINVFLDLVQTPRDKSVSAMVRNDVRKRLKSTSLVEAYDMDSQSTDALQMADLVASSIRYGRVCDPTRTTPKSRISGRLRRAFELENFNDIQHGKVNILTMRNNTRKKTLPIPHRAQTN